MLDGMTPEDAFALGIQKGLALVKEFGRNGDTELAHVNPEEKEMLEARGGSGTTNPATGMPEFYSTDGRGGISDRDLGQSAADRAQGNADRGRDDRGGIRDRQLGKSAAERAVAGQGGVSSNPNSVTTSSVASDMDAQRNQTQSSPPDERSLGERLADGLEAAFSGPSFGPPSKADPGFLGVGAGLFPGIGTGMAISRGMQAMGIPNREKQPGELGTDEYSGQRDDRILSPGSKPKPQQQNQTPQFPWSRPGQAPTAPGGLNFDGGMTPLQQRASIATGGTNADAGIYRDPAVVDFYRNLALYDLTAPGGAVAEGAKVLPIEQQYLSQVTGASAGSSVEDFLKALSGL